MVAVVDPLGPADINRFVRNGFVRLVEAFSPEIAGRAAAVLVNIAEIDASGRDSWTTPVSRVEGSIDPHVIDAINSVRLVAAIDQLVGVGQWQPRTDGYGSFPIRFPSETDPGDAGWHVDGSFGQPPHYKINHQSKGRALLLVMLFTDVTMNDAPTRIRVGSHRHVVRHLHTIDENGTNFDPERDTPSVSDLPIDHAIGAAGTVYLCHPFIVHAASWPHTGTGPRVIGQPAIHHPEGEQQGCFDYQAKPDSPVKRAAREALRNQ